MTGRGIKTPAFSLIFDEGVLLKRDIDQAIARYQHDRAAGASLEQMIFRLHEDGFSIIDSFKVIRAVYTVDLADARYMVSAHPIWSNYVHLSPAFFLNTLALPEDATYSDWLRVYQFGLSRDEWVAPARDQDRQQEIAALLQQAARLEGEEQRSFLHEIAHASSDMLGVLLALVENGELSLRVLIVGVIRALGFPNNRGAIPWLIELAGGSSASAVQDVALQTLLALESSAIVPFFIAILLHRVGEDKEWAQAVTMVCQLLKAKKAWASACAPAVTYLLGRSEYAQDDRPDIMTLLSVLETIPFACAYAIPVVYRIAVMDRDGERGTYAAHILSLFNDNDRALYQYRLKDRETELEELR